jgi:hypothetical protein
MTHEEKIRLFKTYALLQMTVFSIDELTESKTPLHDVRMLSNRLSELIVKKHGKNISTLWDVEGGEAVNSEVLNIFEELFTLLGSASTAELLMSIEVIKGIKSGEITIEKQNS